MVASSLQSRRNFGGRVLSIFLTNIMAAIFDLNGSGRLGERRKFVPKGRSSVKNKERGRGWEVKIFALRPPPTPTVHSNSKSNIAGRINDCELLTLARTSKTPVLQARWLAVRVELWDWGRSKRHSFQGSGRCTSRRVTVCLVAGYFLFFFFSRCGKGGEACEHSESSQKGLKMRTRTLADHSYSHITGLAARVVAPIRELKHRIFETQRAAGS